MHDPPVGIHNTGDMSGAMLNDDAGLMFFPIVKNAHTSMERWIKTVGFHAVFGVDKADAIPYRCFALVREPVDRYISGLHQVWSEWVAADTEWEPFIAGVDRWNVRNGRPWNSGGNLHFASQHSRIGMMPNRTLFGTHDTDGMREWLTGYGLESEPVGTFNANIDTRREYAVQALTHDIVLAHYKLDCDYWAESQQPKEKQTWQRSSIQIG